MTDSPLEELEHREHAEHALHAAESGDPLILQVTFTIALLAVLAAISASLETTESDAAISAKNDSVLAQDQATDYWGFANSKSLRRKVYEVAVDQGGAKTGAYVKSAQHEAADQAAATGQAKSFEKNRDAALERAELHERRHGRLTVSSTLLHMAIAIATLAILLGRRWPWAAALALSAAGVAVAIWAYF
jgi:glucosamine 6-phosphate synthetase-like amidotransferase/phosphosugar isomerase protein